MQNGVDRDSGRVAHNAPEGWFERRTFSGRLSPPRSTALSEEAHQCLNI